MSTKVDRILEYTADNCRMARKKRSSHIHDCIRRDVAHRLLVSESDLQYCYECMTWRLKTEWRDHCDYHLKSWSDRHCEVIVYRYTVIRPGYCPCCLWNQGLPADDRLKYWLYSADMRRHVEEKHIEKVEWPTNGPICGCSQLFESERDFRYHLHDVHGLADGIWKPRKLTMKRKRAAKTEPACADEKVQEPKLKKIQFQHYKPLHQHLKTPDSHEWPMTIQAPVPVPAQASSTFWEYPCPPSYPSSDALGSLASESGTADISAPTSPLSSLRTTPDLELIDPRILDPLWSGSGGPLFINGTCDASNHTACADDGGKYIIQEITDDLTMSHLDAVHVDNHRLESDGFRVTADTASNTSAAPDDVHPSSPDVATRDELPDRPFAGCGQKPSFANSICEIPSASEGPVTRARARAEQTRDVDKLKSVSKRQHRFTPTERETLQALKDQGLAWNQIKSYFPQKPISSLQQAWESTRQLSTQHHT